MNFDDAHSPGVRFGVRGRYVAVVALFALAVGLSKALRGSPGHQRARGPAPLLVAPLVALWLAGGIVDSITGAIGWATSPIYDAVKRLVDGVVGWVSDWVGHVVDWTTRLVNDVWGVVNTLSDWAHSVAGWIGGEWNRVSSWISAQVDRVTSWVGQRLGDITNWARGELDRIYGYARGIVDDAYTWVTDNVWRPLHDLVDGIGRWISDTILPWVSAQIEGLSSWARSAFDWVLQHAEDLIGQALDVFTPAWQLVTAAWGWLEWMATHTFDWFTGLWHELADSHPQVVEDMVGRGFGAGGTHLEDAVMRWFD